ncbi:MAG TPA: hypothetical protein VLS93_10255 [Anaeromyxobacteraceae bacterium]|nr:hypothetical protein [Anaeromyxobacteraceae bacterium]
MAEFANGMLVQHASLGVGRVVAVEANAVHVFFPERADRHAAKLRLPDARPLLTVDGIERNTWLEGLSSFALDPETGRYALAANFITHDRAIADFLARHPRELGGPGAEDARTPTRTSRWRSASAEWAQAFGQGEAERLVKKGDAREIVRRAARLERHLVLVPGTFGAHALQDALRDGEATQAFLEAVLDVLSVPEPARSRMERLFEAAQDLPVEPSMAWPIATILPFLADPAHHVFLWPRSACAAAARLGCDLRWEPAPRWPTYAALHGLSARLLGKLKAHGARDFADVESFLFATASQRTPATGGRAGPEARGAAARAASVRRPARQTRGDR